MNEDSIYYFKNHLAWQMEPLSKTVYIFDLKNDKVYFIQDTGKDIWNLIDNKLSIKSIISLLSKRYDIDEKKLKNDIFQFVLDMVREDLIYVL